MVKVKGRWLINGATRLMDMHAGFNAAVAGFMISNGYARGAIIPTLTGVVEFIGARAINYIADRQEEEWNEKYDKREIDKFEQQWRRYKNMQANALPDEDDFDDEDNIADIYVTLNEGFDRPPVEVYVDRKETKGEKVRRELEEEMANFRKKQKRKEGSIDVNAVEMGDDEWEKEDLGDLEIDDSEGCGLSNSTEYEQGVDPMTEEQPKKKMGAGVHALFRRTGTPELPPKASKYEEPDLEDPEDVEKLISVTTKKSKSKKK